MNEDLVEKITLIGFLGSQLGIILCLILLVFLWVGLKMFIYLSLGLAAFLFILVCIVWWGLVVSFFLSGVPLPNEEDGDFF